MIKSDLLDSRDEFVQCSLYSSPSLVLANIEQVRLNREVKHELKPLSRKAPSSLYEGRTYLELIRAPDIRLRYLPARQRQREIELLTAKTDHRPERSVFYLCVARRLSVDLLRTRMVSSLP